jgi:hypothetical protein
LRAVSTEAQNAARILEDAAPAHEQPKATRPWIWLTCALILLLVALAYAFYTTFSQALGLDEGYLMITVQSFLEGQPLYDVVFTQYGPVYYVYEWFLHRVLSIPLTHDATRWLCIVHWLSAAALLGVLGRIMTGSLLAGLFASSQGVLHLAHLGREPGHPQEIIALLLALGVVAANRIDKKTGLPALGAVAAVLLFIKPNVGIFFAAALFLAIYFHSNRAGSGASGRTWLLIAGCALLPFLLMRRYVMFEWCRNYSLLAALAIVAAALTARDVASHRVSLRRCIEAAIAFVAVAIVFAGIAMSTGTSAAGLLDGLLLTPLRTPDIAILPLRVPNAAVLNAVAALLVAMLASATAGHASRDSVITFLKLCFVLITSFVLIGQPSSQLVYILPWVWLVAVPGGSGTTQRALATSFPRVFLSLASAWQSLQAYPVAGTQLAIGSMLLVVATTVSLADALIALRIPERIRTIAAHWRTSLAGACQGLAAIAVVGFFALVWCKLPAARRNYATLAQLNLPGADLVRTDTAMVQGYQALAQYLRANSDTFITCPGINDFYFWTGKRPPTHLNPTTMSILTARQQEQILAGLRRAEKPLIVILESIVDDPGRRGSGTIRVLLEALRNEYVEVHHIPPFKIYALKRDKNPPP